MSDFLSPTQESQASWFGILSIFQKKIIFSISRWDLTKTCYRDCQIKTSIVSWLPLPAALSYDLAIAQTCQSPRINSSFYRKLLWLHLAVYCSVAPREVPTCGNQNSHWSSMIEWPNPPALRRACQTRTALDPNILACLVEQGHRTSPTVRVLPFSRHS